MEKDIKRARTLSKRWADKLDAQTTKSGSYVRHQGEQLPETDPWGNNLKVYYSSGGVSEVLRISSAGPDLEFDTEDDIVETRMTANLAGVGEGIKESISEVAENAATGAVKGTIKGVKEGVKDSLPKWLKKKENQDLDTDEE